MPLSENFTNVPPSSPGMSEQLRQVTAMAASRAAALFDELNIQQHQFSELGSGAFHCVFSFSARDLDGQNHLFKDYVLRISTAGEDDKTADQAAVLNHINQHLPVVPRALNWDSRPRNPIHHPYMVMEKKSGRPIGDLIDFPTVTPAEKLQMVESLAKQMAHMETVRFSRSGELAAHTGHYEWKRWLSHEPGTRLSIVNPTRWHSISPEPGKLEDPRKTNETVFAFLADRLIRTENVVQDGGGGINPWDKDEYASFYADVHAVLEEMCDLGLNSYYDDQPVTLFHPDLHPWNVLVETLDGDADQRYKNMMDDVLVAASEDWFVSGIIDWDGAKALHRVLTRAPPVMMWVAPMDKWDEAIVQLQWSGIPELLPPKYLEIADPVLRALKEHFDATMVQLLGPRYLEDAYGSGSWVRKLSYFILRTPGDPRHLLEWDRFKYAWLEWSAVSLLVNLLLPDSFRDYTNFSVGQSSGAQRPVTAWPSQGDVGRPMALTERCPLVPLLPLSN